MRLHIIGAVALLSMLAGCGGGGGGSQPIPPISNNPAPEADAEIIQLESSLAVGQSTELILFSDKNLSGIQWQQTSGPDVTFYAPDSKVIGFSPSQAGNYSFAVEFTVDNAQPETLSHDFTVTNDQAQLTVRLGHAAVEGIPVSLVSYASGDDQLAAIDKSSWRWTQTQGPAVTFTDNSTDGEVAVFFDAPSVSEDTLLAFELSGEVNGQTYSDTVAVLVENSAVEVPASDAPFTDRIAEVFLYNPDSPGGQRLIDCVYSNNSRYDDCTFGDSPLIAQISTTPTTDDIMDRVIVSHKWMGDQFKQFLEEYDPNDDFKNLLRANTAVVISYDIRPSFYSPTTAAIYLDPSDLWVTPEQRDTINQAPDYRSSFGNELQFEMPWRYVKDNDYASYYAPIRYRLSRTLADSQYDFASLLYHELAHANDFFPSTDWLSHSNSRTIYDAVVEVYNAQEIQSDYLQDNYPLDSLYGSGGQNELTKLAQVRFRDPDLITEQQKTYSPQDVADMFKTEGAPQFYSYSSTREDLAILFDGFMMHARYGVSRDIAVSDQDYADIVWGQRGRLSEGWIKPRVYFVATRILPEFSDAAAVVEALAPPLALDDAKSWRESVVIDGDTSDKGATKRQAEKSLGGRLIPLEGMHRHRVLDAKSLGAKVH